MEWLYALDLVLFGLLLISLPLYILLIYTLVKYRKSDELKGSFFTLSISLGVADVAHLLINWCLGKFGALAWFGVHKLVMISPRFFAKFTALTWNYTTFVQKVGVLLAAVNRLTVISSGFDWTPGWVKVSLVVNWAVPVIFTAVYLPFEIGYYNVSSTGGVQWYYEYGAWAWHLFLGCAVLCGVLATASGVCYMIIFWKARAHRQQVEQLVESSSRKAEFNLALVGFALFVLTALCGAYCTLLTFSTNPIVFAFAVPFESVLFDVYSWINPYLLLVCSSHVRKHMKAAFLCRNPNAVAQKSATGSNKRGGTR